MEPRSVGWELYSAPSVTGQDLKIMVIVTPIRFLLQRDFWTRYKENLLNQPKNPELCAFFKTLKVLEKPPHLRRFFL